MSDLEKIVKSGQSKSQMHALIDSLTDAGNALLLIDDPQAGVAIHGFNTLTHAQASYMLADGLYMVHRRATRE